MRRDEKREEAVFVFESLENRVPQDHPLRRIRPLIDTALRDLDPLFADLYAETGRLFSEGVRRRPTFSRNRERVLTAEVSAAFF